MGLITSPNWAKARIQIDMAVNVDEIGSLIEAVNRLAENSSSSIRRSCVGSISLKQRNIYCVFFFDLSGTLQTEKSGGPKLLVHKSLWGKTKTSREV